MNKDTKMENNNTLLKKRWISPKEFSMRYMISPSTQAKYRMKKSKINLPFSKIGKFIIYDSCEIDKWIEDNKVSTC